MYASRYKRLHLRTISRPCSTHQASAVTAGCLLALAATSPFQACLMVMSSSSFRPKPIRWSTMKRTSAEQACSEELPVGEVPLLQTLDAVLNVQRMIVRNWSLFRQAVHPRALNWTQINKRSWERGQRGRPRT